MIFSKKIIKAIGILLISSSLAASTMITEEIKITENIKWTNAALLVPSNKVAKLVDKIIIITSGITGSFLGNYSGKVIACKCTNKKTKDIPPNLLWLMLKGFTTKLRDPLNSEIKFLEMNAQSFWKNFWEILTNAASEKSDKCSLLTQKVQFWQTLGSIAGVPLGVLLSKTILRIYHDNANAKIARKILRQSQEDLKKQLPTEICKIVAGYRCIIGPMPSTDSTEMISRIRQATQRNKIWTKNILEKIAPKQKKTIITTQNQEAENSNNSHSTAKTSSEDKKTTTSNNKNPQIETH